MIFGIRSYGGMLTALVLGLCSVVMTYGLFSVYRHIFLGSSSDSVSGIVDLSYRERGYLFPLVAALVVLIMFWNVSSLK